MATPGGGVGASEGDLGTGELTHMGSGLSDDLESLDAERDSLLREARGTSAPCRWLSSSASLTPRAWSLARVRDMLVREGAGGRAESLDSSLGEPQSDADVGGGHGWMLQQPVVEQQGSSTEAAATVYEAVPQDAELREQWDGHASLGASMLAEEAMRTHADLEEDSSSVDDGDHAARLDSYLQNVAGDGKSQPVQLLPRNNSESSLLDVWEQEALCPRSRSSAANGDSAVHDGSLAGFALNEEAQSRREPQAGHDVFVPSARRSFKSIAEALRNASAGDAIHLAQGTYVEHEPLEVLVDNVTLCGAQQDSVAEEAQCSVEIQLRGPLASVVCRANGFRASNLKLVQCSWGHAEQVASSGCCDSQTKPEHAAACVAVLSGDANFDRCRITSSVGHGMYIAGDASPLIKLCSIDKCADVAVLCCGRCSPTLMCNTLRKNKSFSVAMTDSCAGSLVGNTILKSGKCAVLCSGRSSTICLRNSVSDGKQGAFWIQGDSRVRLVNNVMRNNVKAGLQVSQRACPTVTGNSIHQGQGGGIVVHDRARGHFAHNVIENSMRAGIGVMDHAAPYMEMNHVGGNEGGGAIVTGASSPVMVRNTFSANGFVGVGFKESCSALFIDNTVEANAGYGMLLQGACSVHVQGCKIAGNARTGVCVCDEGRLTMCQCLVQPLCGGSAEDAAQHGPGEGPEQVLGLMLQDMAKAVVRQSVFRRHSAAHVVLRHESQANVTLCELSDSSCGIKMYGRSFARVRHNSLQRHSEAHILLTDGAELRASYNGIMSARGSGVQASRCARCILSHNNIMCNQGMGVDVSDRVLLEMRANRVSANGQYGVRVDGTGCRLRANVIFGNQLAGLFLKHASPALVHGNCIMRGGGLALQLEGAQRTGMNVSDFCENMLQLDQDTIKMLPPSFHKENVSSIESGSRAIVRHSLQVLDEWVQMRAGHIVVAMPDGSTAIATPARHDAKTLQFCARPPQTHDLVKEAPKQGNVPTARTTPPPALAPLRTQG